MKLIRVISTAWCCACIARDLWRGLNAGSLRYDTELIDEDPPRPEVQWVPDKVPTIGLQPAWSARSAGWRMSVTTKRISAAGVVCGWEWQAMLDFTPGPTYEYVKGTTAISEDEAKRRAEEALAVMLEHNP